MPPCPELVKAWEGLEAFESEPLLPEHRREEPEGVFDLAKLLRGGTLVTRNGRYAMRFVAYCALALPGQQLIVIDLETQEIEKYHADGLYYVDREKCGMDLFVVGA